MEEQWEEMGKNLAINFFFGQSQLAKEPPGADDQHLDGGDGERGVREICRNLLPGRLVLPWPEQPDINRTG